MGSPRITRVAACLLSIILLAVIGGVGESLLNLFHLAIRGMDVRGVTSWVIRNYPLNSAHFLFSLTPFMILFAAMAASRPEGADGPDRLLFAFISVWLVVLIYVGLFALALLAPFHVLMIVLGYTPLWYAVAAVDVLLVILSAAFIARGHLRHKRVEAGL